MPSNTAPEEFDVIIIGAGVAGVTCARKLSDEWPEKKVVVLEGSDRVGGQVWTSRSLGEPVDLGASSILDFHNMNPLYPLMRGKVPYRMSDMDFISGSHFTINGTKLDYSDEQFLELESSYAAFKARVNEHRQEIFDRKDPDASLAEVLALVQSETSLTKSEVEYFSMRYSLDVGESR
ncbi:hypothetical protein HDU93_004194, partial [Gonapodya sp. JEL0774]